MQPRTSVNNRWNQRRVLAFVIYCLSPSSEFKTDWAIWSIITSHWKITWTISRHYGHICIKNCKDSRDYNDSKTRESRAILLKNEKILYTDSYFLRRKYELFYFKLTSIFYVFIDKIHSKVRFKNTKSRNLCDWDLIKSLFISRSRSRARVDVKFVCVWHFERWYRGIVSVAADAVAIANATLK